MSIILFITMLFSGCKTHDTDNIDGGVRHNNTDPDAPKVIESSEIVSFDCKLSLLAIPEEDSEFSGRVYKLCAALENGTVSGKIDWHGRPGDGNNRTFSADASFMEALQEIAVKYDFAKHNGYSYSVSGLPDMYGARLDIKYASGESIYAFNNQDCFIQLDAVQDLIRLFSSAEEE